MLLRRQMLMMTLLAAASSANAARAPWQAFRNGAAIVLLRHAVAPGTGDPSGFRLDACGTQRNLSESGRQQARRIGDAFRRQSVTQARVFSSQWCRCLDTAALLDLGPVEPEPRLNSFFGRSSAGAQQTEALRNWVARLPSGSPVVLVTHQVNITGLTSVVPSSGELVFVASADPTTVLARLPTQQ
ncbi:MAG: histidine phosphatase family protein [Rhizobium sp.]|nr:histidine phosphatase family protein [Rhizobium sp.]